MRQIGLMLAIGLVIQPLARAFAQGQAPRFETTSITGGVYQFRWQSHNGFFVVTDAGVVAVDPISTEAAATYAAEIKRVAPGKRLLAVVYSHDHADHATGAGVLKRAMGNEGAPIFAHELAVPKLQAANSPDLPLPDSTFADRRALTYGGRAVELRYLGKSHSDNMLVAYLPQERIVFAVDFVSNDRVGYRDLPDYHFPDFFTALERLQQIDYQTIVFGHGPPGDKASVDRQIRYYTDLRNAVEQAVRQGWSEDRTAAEVKLPAYERWGSYADWFPLNVRAIYRWVAARGARG
ncbi:MAG: MBL fold metallo-hydrolase [Gemmatimonadetes bacterium]|nr:MBL fold metallo-hydrolase [Gemmatimonadota bacterium]